MMHPKILSWIDIGETVRQWRDESQIIVFTNGCFDLLHPGHLDLLTNAKALGDKLIVGLNSDSSVKKLKGEKRPFYNQDERMTMLSALEVVSNVVLFEEETPQKLIEWISPHILVKGADYKMSNIVGADFVIKSGGKVEILSLKEGFSTTSIIERLKLK